MIHRPPVLPLWRYRSARNLTVVALCAVSTLGGGGSPARSQPLPAVTVGVLDLDPINFDTAAARIISDRLRLYVANQPVFALVERNKMADLMAEYGFQLSGACSSDDCAIQIGKVLSARMMIAGSIGRIETIYTLQVRIIDTETSTVAFTAFSDAGSVAQVLESATAAVARELANKLMQEAGTKAPLLPARGRVNVRSDPPGATILVEGQRAGTTPAALGLRAGGYEIGLERPGFKPYRGNIEVDEGGTVDLEARLERDINGFAEIRSEPPSASVFIDGEYAGVTPLARLELPVGAHPVTFRLAGYQAEPEVLEITAGRTSTLAARLSGTGRGVLSVLSEPRNSIVRIDDAVVGTTPLLLPLPEGSYRVKLSRAGYGSVTRTIEVKGGRPVEVSIQLQVLPPPG